MMEHDAEEEIGVTYAVLDKLLNKSRLSEHKGTLQPPLKYNRPS